MRRRPICERFFFPFMCDELRAHCVLVLLTEI